MQSHLLLRRIDMLGTLNASYGMWATHPPSTLVIFVHGFLGSAMSTWRQFDSLAPEQDEFHDADLVFLGYKSVAMATNITSAILLDSCHSLVVDSTVIVNSSISLISLHRPEGHSYERILFVAHSLGAIITRQILLSAQQRAYAWVDKVEMVLFAPAHRGATDVRKLLSSLVTMLGPLSAPVGTLVAWKAQTLSELKNESVTLTDLKDRSEKAISERRLAGAKTGHLIAKCVIFGEKEDVVETAAFCEDPLLQVIPSKGHQDVCKPHTRYKDPVTVIWASSRDEK